MTLWYLSFAAEAEGAFCGAAIIEADGRGEAGVRSAVERADELGLIREAGGSELVVIPLVDMTTEEEAHYRAHTDRLISLDELQQLFGVGLVEAGETDDGKPTLEYQGLIKYPQTFDYTTKPRGDA